MADEDVVDPQKAAASARALTELAASLELLGKAGQQSNKALAESANTAVSSLNAFKASLGSFGGVATTVGRSVSDLTRYIVGAGGFIGSIYLLGRGLESMSRSAINVGYTARELGMSVQSYERLVQAFRRLGFGADESSEKVQRIASHIRDLAAKGPASEVYDQLSQLGAGGNKLAWEMIRVTRETGSVEGAFLLLANAARSSDPLVRQYVAGFLEAPERIQFLAGALSRTTTQYSVSERAAAGYHNAMIDMENIVNKLKVTIGESFISKLVDLYQHLDKAGDFAKLKNYIEGIPVDALAEKVEKVATSIAHLLEVVGITSTATAAPAPTSAPAATAPAANVPLPPTRPPRPTATTGGGIFSRIGRWFGVGETGTREQSPQGQRIEETLRELTNTEGESSRTLEELRDIFTGGAGGGGGGAGGSVGGPNVPGGGAGNVQLPEGQRLENARRAYAEARRLGYSHEQAAGMLAHIQGESDFNPRTSGDFGTAHGLFQHRGVRWQNQLAKAREWGLDPYSPEASVRFFDWEMRNDPGNAFSGRGTYGAFKSARTVDEAVTALNAYEGFRGWQLGQARRYQYGRKWVGSIDQLRGGLARSTAEQEATSPVLAPWGKTNHLDRVLRNMSLRGSANIDIDVGGAKTEVSSQKNDVFAPVSIENAPQMWPAGGTDASWSNLRTER